MEQPTLDSVINQDKVGDPVEPLPPDGTSFLNIDSSNIVLVTWKIAEDGKGTILRLQETGGKATEANIRLPHAAIHSVSLCNSVEDKLTDVPMNGNQFHLAFHPYEVLTVRLEP
jgi:alpha-mannosidase